MEKVNKFFENHGSKLIILLLLLVYFKSCTVNTELSRVKKELVKTQLELDSTNVKINKLPNKIDLEIEGLKSEKRMIQATDRKIFDVNRQNQIEIEIKKLEEKK
jgi:hypothetical protein